MSPDLLFCNCSQKRFPVVSVDSGSDLSLSSWTPHYHHHGVISFKNHGRKDNYKIARCTMERKSHSSSHPDHFDKYPVPVVRTICEKKKEKVLHVGVYRSVESTELSKFINYQFITNQKPKFL